MRCLVVSAILAVAVSSSASINAVDVRLALVVASARARFSSAVPPTERIVSLARKLTDQVPLISVSDTFLNMREAEEVCSTSLGELFSINQRRIKQTSHQLDPVLLQVHGRAIAGLKAYESALHQAEAKATGEHKEGLQEGVVIVQKSLSALGDIKRLLKSNLLGQVVNERVKLIRGHSGKFLEAKQVAEDILLPAGESLDSLLQTTVKTLAAMRKVMASGFEAEMRYMRVKLKPRVSVKAREGVQEDAMSLLEPKLEYGKAYSSACILVRRLNVVMQVANALLSIIGQRLSESLPTTNAAHKFLAQMQLRISGQRTTVLALTDAVPAQFPLVRSKKQALEDSADIRHFISRYVAVAEAEQSLAKQL